MIQQNSFNLTSDNLEILIFGHIKNVVLKPEILFYQKEKFINERGRFQGHVQKWTPKCLYSNHCGPA